MEHTADRLHRVVASRRPDEDLRNYYLLRAGVAAVWVVAAFTAGRSSAVVGGVLLVAYPSWDALANLFDAKRHGGLAENRAQALNFVVSGLTAVAVALAIASGRMAAAISIFGGWAILAGLLQLAAGVRRWKHHGAQWAMILSGAQSALAGGHFIQTSLGAAALGVTTVAPYAGFGAFYFLVSAIALSVRRR